MNIPSDGMAKQNKRPAIVVSSALFISLAAVAYAAYMRFVSEFYISESMGRLRFTDEQRHVVGSSFHFFGGVYFWLLVLTSVLWVAVGFYLLSRLRRMR
jgi:hypothetical protein